MTTNISHVKGGKVASANRADEMNAFDELPPQCREALNYAPFNLAALDMRYAVRRYGQHRALDMFNNFIRNALDAS